jgi:hypothetical protein
MIRLLKKLFGKNRKVAPTEVKVEEPLLSKEEIEWQIELQKELNARSRELTEYMQKGLSNFLYGK